jgi:hypothetical protein
MLDLNNRHQFLLRAIVLRWYLTIPKLRRRVEYLRRAVYFCANEVCTTGCYFHGRRVPLLGPITEDQT